MRRAGLLAALLALGCAHEPPFPPPDNGVERPFADLPPYRLTYNLGTDITPSWLPDGSGIIYTAERGDRDDGDWCIAELPIRGGRIRRYYCAGTGTRDDSLDTFRSAAVAPDGRIILYWTVGRPGAYNATKDATRSRRIASGVLGGPENPGTLKPVPYTLPGAALHLAVSQIRWLGSDAAIFRGDYAAWVCYTSGPGCPQIWMVFGLALVRVTLGDPPSFEIVPGGDDASSVAVGSTPDEIYFTRNGESGVYRQILSTGDIDTVFDFGGPIARDVQVSGTRLVAVVGGDVTYRFAFSANRLVQEDNGGDVHVVDLATRSDAVLNGGGRLYRSIALSPDGRRIVAESWNGDVADLYLFEVP